MTRDPADRLLWSLVAIATLGACGGYLSLAAELIRWWRT